jgi:uncharacterized membrane protein YkoI
MNRFAICLFTLILGASACTKTNTTDVTPDVVTITPDAPVETGAGGGGSVIAETDVPQAAKDVIAATFPGYTLTKVERDTERNVVVYELHINNGVQKKTLIYNKEWKLVATHVGGDHHTGGDHRDTVIVHTALPKAVKDSLAKFFAGFTIVKITQERKNGVTFFEVEVKNAAGKKTLIFDLMGHARKEEVEVEGVNTNPNENKDRDHNEGFKLAELSQLVKNYVKANYAGYVVEDVVKVVKDKVTTYQVEIKLAKVEKTLIFDANWVFVKVK